MTVEVTVNGIDYTNSQVTTLYHLMTQVPNHTYYFFNFILITYRFMCLTLSYLTLSCLLLSCLLLLSLSPSIPGHLRVPQHPLRQRCQQWRRPRPRERSRHRHERRWGWYLLSRRAPSTLPQRHLLS